VPARRRRRKHYRQHHSQTAIYRKAKLTGSGPAVAIQGLFCALTFPIIMINSKTYRCQNVVWRQCHGAMGGRDFRSAVIWFDELPGPLCTYGLMATRRRFMSATPDTWDNRRQEGTVVYGAVASIRRSCQCPYVSSRRPMVRASFALGAAVGFAIGYCADSSLLYEPCWGCYHALPTPYLTATPATCSRST
jgi:hypothetical protein